MLRLQCHLAVRDGVTFQRVEGRTLSANPAGEILRVDTGGNAVYITPKQVHELYEQLGTFLRSVNAPTGIQGDLNE